MSRLMDMGLERLKSVILDMGKLSEDAVATAVDVHRGNGKTSLDKIYELSEQICSCDKSHEGSSDCLDR